MLFPINTLTLNNLVVLVRTDQAESSTGKFVIIGYPREDWKNKKISGREVVLIRTSRSLSSFIGSRGWGTKQKLQWKAKGRC